MTTSWGRFQLFICDYYFFPLIGGEVEDPDIVELIAVLVSAAKYDHGVAEDQS